MSNPEQNIELETTDIEQYVKLGEALERLRKHPDFKLVIMTNYIEQKALSAVSLLAVPAIKKRGERPDVMEELVSISNLQYYFAMIENFYEGAKQDLSGELDEEDSE